MPARATKHLKAEAADLLYHLLVLLESRGVAIADVLAVLDKRSGVIWPKGEGRTTEALI